MRISDWSSDVCSSDLNPHKYPRHPPPGRIAAKLQNQVDGRPHISEDILALERRAPFQHQQRELLERPLDAVGVDRRHRSGMPGIDCRSEEHTSELQSLMRISYAVFCLKKTHKKKETYKKH